MAKCVITIEDGDEHPVSVKAEFDSTLEEMMRKQSFTFAEAIGLDCVRYLQETFGVDSPGDQALASTPQ